MSDSDFEEIENAEKTLLKSLKAKKLHEFDNVAFDKEGVMYALEDISAGDEIIKNGNLFAKAKKSIEADLHARNMPEVEYFFKHFIPSFELTLDELETL
jgi:sulfur transfer complex TusBCD TusB component (DsrH family)